MAGISRVVSGFDEQQARFVRVGAERRREALGVLLSGEPAGHPRAVAQFLEFAGRQGLSLEHLWLAEPVSGPPVAALVVPNVGRTAMLFVSPAAKWPSVGLAAALVRRACEGVAPGSATLIQSLLDHGRGRTREALEAGGFEELAVLVYMQRRGSAGWVALEPEAWGLTLYRWDQRHHERFARTILASYEGTRDCPGLLGLRHIDDIIAGHQASGEFDPRLWYCLCRGEEPAAVMLLSDVPSSDALELVYLGLAPAWRGQGLARRLMQHGLSVVHERDRSSMILAVDEQNEPAMKLYRELGFQATTRKTAMIYRVAAAGEG